MKRISRRKKPAYPGMRKLLNLAPSDPVPSVAFLANAEDERTGKAAEVYVFKKPGNRFGTETVPRDKVRGFPSPPRLALQGLGQCEQLGKTSEGASLMV